MILIIANARIKGGLSGSDNIYEHLANHTSSTVMSMVDVDFKPFALCYIWKIIRGCWEALWDTASYEYVYSASDFWMDCLPALVHKIKGHKWVAGFYLFAPRDTFIYYWTQKLSFWLIDTFADVVCVTNESMFTFQKPMIAVHGGIDRALAYTAVGPKEYDAVFVGRLHYTKGIDELIRIWGMVLARKPDAKLAIIGDGDTEVEKIRSWKAPGVDWLGYLGEERFDVYRKSKLVLYPTPDRYSHFSMGPVEAMACGCPMVAFDTDVMRHVRPDGTMFARTEDQFADFISYLITRHKIIEIYQKRAKKWADTWDWSKRAPEILGEIRRKLCAA